MNLADPEREATEPIAPTAWAHEELVSVIIPAYNSATWIDATLQSVRAQTHRNLEIFVIDDGSTDATREVAERHAQLDPRVVVLAQANAGVAAARNLALSKARGRYFAPIDADDLWVSDKIERQLEAVDARQETVGLVYCWYLLISESGQILDRVRKDNAEGNVIDAMSNRNIVGNGSSPLILRTAALAVGGYDTTLRDRDAEGCEDYKLYFQIAERYPFALIRDYLIGYRQHSTSMSRRVEKMIKSRAIVTGEILQRHPGLARRLRQGNVRAKRYLMTAKLRTRQFADAIFIFHQMLREDAIYAMGQMGVTLYRAARNGLRESAKIAGVARIVSFPIGAPLAAKAAVAPTPQPPPAAYRNASPKTAG